MSHLKISEAFNAYLSCKADGSLIQNMISIFDRMTEYILNSTSIDSNADLLIQLSICRKTNDPDKSNRLNLFAKFFDVYSQYIDNRSKTQTIIVRINAATMHLMPGAKSDILNFVWSMSGFRKGLSSFKHEYYDGTPYKGIDYMTTSIFAPLFGSIKQVAGVDMDAADSYVSNSFSAKAFDSLTIKTEQSHFVSIFGYLMTIVRSNRPYTFESVLNYAKELSPFELLGTIMIITIRLCANNAEYTVINVADFWDLIDICYFTIYEIRRSTRQSYDFNKKEVARLTNLYKQSQNSTDLNLINSISKYNTQLAESEGMLNRISSILAEVDTKFVHFMIFDFAIYSGFISSVDTGRLSRLQRYMIEVEPVDVLRYADGICCLAHTILESRVPAYMKSEYMRIIMSYGLTDTFKRTDNRMRALNTYVLTDATKLGDVAVMHSLDVLEHFDEALYSNNRQIIRLYLGYLESTNELYTKIVGSFLTAPDSIKPNIIRDMSTIMSCVPHLISIIGSIGHESLEYIEPLMVLIKNIYGTREMLNQNMTVNEITETDSDLNSIKTVCVDRFGPLILAMFERLHKITVYDGPLDIDTDVDVSDIPPESASMLSEIFEAYYIKPDLPFTTSVLRLILSSNTVDVMRNILGVDLDVLGIPYVLQEAYSSDTDEMLDAVTGELLISPVAIPISNAGDQALYINQKTLHKLMLKKTNPYTRQRMTYDDVLSIGTRPDVRAGLYSIMLNLITF